MTGDECFDVEFKNSRKTSGAEALRKQEQWLGGVEDPYDTYVLMSNSAEIRSMFALYFISIFAYNMLAVLVTFLLDSVWHAILDNFRPITVWAVDLMLYYTVTAGGFGEAWTYPGSYVQLAGLVVLVGRRHAQVP